MNDSDVFKISENMEVRLLDTDEIIERDVNARVMDNSKFDLLVGNIKREGMLESLPLVHKTDKADGKYELISGHHRTRASRRAGLKKIPVLVITKHLTEDEIISKQISHNSIDGYDDPETLKRLYDSISSFDWKVASGVTELDFDITADHIPVVDVDVDFNFEPVLIMFMKPDVDKFRELIDTAKSLAEEKYLANMTEFRKFAKVVNSVSDYSDIHNIAGIMSIICDLAKERLSQLKAETTTEDEE